MYRNQYVINMMGNNDDSSYLLNTYINQLFKTTDQCRDYCPCFTDDDMESEKVK